MKPGAEPEVTGAAGVQPSSPHSLRADSLMLGLCSRGAHQLLLFSTHAPCLLPSVVISENLMSDNLGTCTLG